jgi:hypothetical protein
VTDKLVAHIGIEPIVEDVEPHCDDSCCDGEDDDNDWLILVVRCSDLWFFNVNGLIPSHKQR